MTTDTFSDGPKGASVDRSAISRRRVLGLAGAGAVVLAGASVPLVRLALNESAPNANVLDLLDVTEATFSPFIGDAFDVAGSAASGLTLLAVEPRGPQQFSLTFEGRADRALAEKIHPISHRKLGRFDLFMVVGSPAGSAVRYVAAFNHGGR